MAIETTKARIESITYKIRDAAEKSGRDMSDITILGACKQVGIDRILEAVELGIANLGENQVAEAELKFKSLERPSKLQSLHFIGKLQSNKVRRALQVFDVIQSVDSIRLASRIDQIAGQLNMSMPIYIQVNIGGQQTKEGIDTEQIEDLVRLIDGCRNISLQGLMTVPPHTDHPENSRQYFSELREIGVKVSRMLKKDKDQLDLSMGMTNDYEIAVEEGATVVRLGSAIWGPRPYP